MEGPGTRLTPLLNRSGAIPRTGHEDTAGRAEQLHGYAIEDAAGLKQPPTTYQLPQLCKALIPPNTTLTKIPCPPVKNDESKPDQKGCLPTTFRFETATGMARVNSVVSDRAAQIPH